MICFIHITLRYVIMKVVSSLTFPTSFLFFLNASSCVLLNKNPKGGEFDCEFASKANQIHHQSPLNFERASMFFIQT